MINAIIIEDEKPAMRMLEKNLMEVSSEVHVQAKLTSVKESIEYLSYHPGTDLIFSDVQLPDGLSFEIFEQSGVHIPVIFITGYDEFMLMAFENNGINYLLKPVEKNDLLKALNKYKMLEKHFTTEALPLNSLSRFIRTHKKTRLLVKKGIENIALRLEDIALFYTDHKIVYVVDRFSKKYLVDKNLSDLEEELGNDIFFRANRQYIININYVKGFKPFEKVKLQINLTIPEINHSIIISQETAPTFRRWMCEA
ncbi:MAG TPA: LytTR family DNA-binding domain-containing protein [Chitinophagaceae bacterium]|jgi:Response regulator of the LytR/AlgR family